MIPKIIHYCWFGKKEKDRLIKKCIHSWKSKCPQYQLIEWNEDNYDIQSAPLYVQIAIRDKRWAFATDYIRYHVIYHHGGVYLDTDVELIKRLDPFLNDRCFFGIEGVTNMINSGLGFGAEKGHPIMQTLMKSYEEIMYNSVDMLQNLNTKMDNSVFRMYGFREDGNEQFLRDGVHCFPAEYFAPFYPWRDKMMQKTKNTVSIHWYSLSWLDEADRLKTMEVRKMRKRDRIRHMPNRIGMKLLGISKYKKIKKTFKR